MAYWIQDLEGNTITTGFTRAQVIRGLRENDLLMYGDKFAYRLPVRGRKLVIVKPLPCVSYQIVNQ